MNYEYEVFVLKSIIPEKNIHHIGKMIRKYSLCALMISYLCLGAVKLLLNNTIGHVIGLDAIPTVCTLMCLALMILCVCQQRKKKSLLIFGAIYLAVGLYFLITLMIYPGYWEYYAKDVVGIWDELFCPSTGCLYLVLIILLYDKKDHFLNDLGLCSWINLGYYAVLCMLADRRGYWEAYDAMGVLVEKSYDLGVGYGLIFCATVFLSSFAKKRNPLNLLGVLLAGILALQHGSRGAWICIIIYAVLYFLFMIRWEKRTVRSTVVKALAMVVLAIVGWLFIDQIQHVVGRILSAMSIESRTVDALLSGELFADNGRSFITKYARQAIADGGIWGLGAFGDRPYIAPFFWWGYSHNWILEMLSNFGIIPGAILMLLFVGGITYVFVTCRDKSFLLIYVIFMANAGKLFISDTIWGYPAFWGLIVLTLVYYCGRKSKGRMQIWDIAGNKQNAIYDDACKVSICCLSYNHEKYLRQALDSMVNQKTDFAYEILVMDDASTDSSQEIIREYMERYPDKVRGVLQIENQYSKGVAIVNELFYPLTRGRYIAYCEGDDYWTDENKLQRQVDFLDAHPEYVAHTHECWEVTEDCRTIAEYYFNGCYLPHYDLDLHVNWQILSGQTATVMHRKEAFDLSGLDAIRDLGALKITGDVKKTAILALHGPIYHSGEVMSHHRRVYKGGDSWSAKTAGDNLRIFYFDALDALAEYVQEYYDREIDYSGFKIKMTVTSLYMYVLKRSTDKLETLKYMYRNVKDYPFVHLRLLIMLVRLPIMRTGIKLSRVQNSINYRRTHKGKVK